MELFAAFLLGLGGSFHCIGMCGPIALALPVSGYNNKTFVPGRLLYNLGRIISYSFMGAVFGLLGGKVIFAGFQQGLSIALGSFILIFLLLPGRLRSKIFGFAPVQRSIGKLKFALGNQFKKHGIFALFITGVLNGFLPCGFVYIGLAASAAAGTLIKGAMVMAMFGLGTAPVMLAVSSFSKVISIDFRRLLSKTTPYFAAALALIFIMRGLSLGIPYISPKSDSLHVKTQLQVKEPLCH